MTFVHYYHLIFKVHLSLASCLDYIYDGTSIQLESYIAFIYLFILVLQTFIYLFIYLDTINVHLLLYLFFLILKSLILTCVPKHEPPSHLPKRQLTQLKICKIPEKAPHQKRYADGN